NILLGRDGRVKIADFGLAKVTDPAGVSLTGTRQAMGTPHYMAPEQWERPGEVDHRADIYALGVVLYELLTGELPLGRFDPPSRKIEVDVRVEEGVLRALEKERGGGTSTPARSGPTWTTSGPVSPGGELRPASGRPAGRARRPRPGPGGPAP